MIINVHFKTPDVLDYPFQYLSEDEQSEAREFIEKYLEWGGCINIEFDTEKKTATVKEV